jgi:hypothetical protein
VVTPRFVVTTSPPQAAKVAKPTNRTDAEDVEGKAAISL